MRLVGIEPTVYGLKARCHNRLATDAYVNFSRLRISRLSFRTTPPDLTFLGEFSSFDNLFFFISKIFFLSMICSPFRIGSGKEVYNLRRTYVNVSFY